MFAFVSLPSVFWNHLMTISSQRQHGSVYVAVQFFRFFVSVLTDKLPDARLASVITNKRVFLCAEPNLVNRFVSI